MERLDDTAITTPLERRLGRGAPVVQLAQSVSEILHDIETALTPIVGERGVTALYRRSLHLAGVVHPWLLAGREDPTAWVARLAERGDAEAARGCDAFLRSFYSLLIELIGSALTERLLDSVWNDRPSGPNTKAIP
jgi:hypothetical protein